MASLASSSILNGPHSILTGKEILLSPLLEEKKRNIDRETRSLKNEKVLYSASLVFETIRHVAFEAYKMFYYNYRVISLNVRLAQRFIKISYLFEAILLPVAAWNIAKQTRHLWRGDAQARTDLAISVAGGVGVFGRSLVLFAVGLAHIRVVSLQVLTWTTPLFLATSVLSLASTFAYYRTFLKIRQFEKELSEKSQIDASDPQSSLTSYRSCLALIADKQQDDFALVEEAFNGEPEKVSMRLLEIDMEAEQKLASSKEEDQKAGRLLLNKTLKALKGRIHHVGISAKLQTVASIVALVAAVVLFTSPVAPAAYALGCIGLVVNLGRFIHHKAKEYHYTKALGMHKKWHEWLMV